MADNVVPSSSVDKVYDFLKQRGVNEDVCESFRHEKMDVSAILNADDELLSSLGLVKIGDKLSLRAYCNSYNKSRDKDEERTAAKKRLLDAYMGEKKRKPERKPASLPKESKQSKPTKIKQTRMVHLGWKHYREDEEKYCLVPLGKGGGGRRVELPLTARKYEVIKVCKDLFFEHGKSIYGKEEDMSFALSNFKNEIIEVTLEVNGKDVPFSVGNYIEAHKVRDVRFYLLSRKLDIDTSNDESGAESGDSLLGDENSEGSALIGTSEERQSVFKEQNMEYQESLLADQRKDREIERKRRIQQARSARVLPEPETNYVTVRVRHLSKGLCSHRFLCGSQMSAVYDWVGSLSDEPEHFTLNDHSGNILNPSNQVCDRCTLSMKKAEATPADSDAEVQFLGFGQEEANTSTATVPDVEGAESSHGEVFTKEYEKTNGSVIPGAKLDDYYASIFNASTSNINCDSSMEASYVDSEPEEDDTYGSRCNSPTGPAQGLAKDITEILGELAEGIDSERLTKLNIARNYIWEGTKRALTRKSFSPRNKISVKFTDDFGTSEGAVDWGGPTREFFSLVMQYLHDSQILRGEENCKYISLHIKSLEEGDYKVAGMLMSMSIVHGGPGPHILSPLMFDAIVGDPCQVDIPIEDIYDGELQQGLRMLSECSSVEDALLVLDKGSLATTVDLAGTFIQLRTIDDIGNIVKSTARWFVLDRALPALESLREGLSCLGVLQAMKAHATAFKPVFCSTPEAVITAESMEKLFEASTSAVGSTKAVTESLVLARWNDYLQDVEEGEEDISLADILFFATGCRSLPPRKISPRIEFLHELEVWGKPRYPTANTCSNTLRLPVAHATYEEFKADMSFGIQNGRGFGIA